MSLRRETTSILADGALSAALVTLETGSRRPAGQTMSPARLLTGMETTGTKSATCDGPQVPMRETCGPQPINSSFTPFEADADDTALLKLRPVVLQNPSTNDFPAAAVRSPYRGGL